MILLILLVSNCAVMQEFIQLGIHYNLIYIFYVNQVRKLLNDDPKNSEFLDMEKELMEVIHFENPFLSGFCPFWLGNHPSVREAFCALVTLSFIFVLVC